MALVKQQTSDRKYQTILLIGRPGSGKGTQGRILGEVPGDRQDDVKDDVIRRRFDVYREQTAPLLDRDPSDLIATVDAARAPMEVLGQIVSSLIKHPLDSPGRGAVAVSP